MDAASVRRRPQFGNFLWGSPSRASGGLSVIWSGFLTFQEEKEVEKVQGPDRVARKRQSEDLPFCFSIGPLKVLLSFFPTLGTFTGEAFYISFPQLTVWIQWPKTLDRNLCSFVFFYPLKLSSVISQKSFWSYYPRGQQTLFCFVFI